MRISAIIHARRGQTLVEALVAISILTTGFLGIVTLLTQSFQLNRTTMNDTQATYLAAEGIEVVKSLIDHDVYTGFASGGPSTDDFGASFPHSGYYYPIDYETTSTANVQFSTTPPNTPLYFNPTTDFYSVNAFGGNPTDFVRNIKITDNYNTSGGLVDLDVQSTVTWTDNGISNSITLEDTFYNWIP